MFEAFSMFCSLFKVKKAINSGSRVVLEFFSNGFKLHQKEKKPSKRSKSIETLTNMSKIREWKEIQSTRKGTAYLNLFPSNASLLNKAWICEKCTYLCIITLTVCGFISFYPYTYLFYPVMLSFSNVAISTLACFTFNYLTINITFKFYYIKKYFSGRNSRIFMHFYEKLFIKMPKIY